MVDIELNTLLENCLFSLDYIGKPVLKLQAEIVAISGTTTNFLSIDEGFLSGDCIDAITRFHRHESAANSGKTDEIPLLGKLCGDFITGQTFVAMSRQHSDDEAMDGERIADILGGRRTH